MCYIGGNLRARWTIAAELGPIKSSSTSQMMRKQSLFQPSFWFLPRISLKILMAQTQKTAFQISMQILFKDCEWYRLRYICIFTSLFLRFLQDLFPKEVSNSIGKLKTKLEERTCKKMTNTLWANNTKFDISYEIFSWFRL